MPKATASKPVEGAPAADLPFEAALSRPGEVVDRLENGELELEESLSVFEEGVGLSRRCAAQLDQAEQKIEVLMREGGKLVARDLEGRDDPSGAEEPGPQDETDDGDWE